MIEACSGLVKVDGKLKCKHGFPVFPACRREPMDYGAYDTAAPCVDERIAFRMFPDKGTPPKTQKDEDR